MYHLIVDDRIGLHPERIEQLLTRFEDWDALPELDLLWQLPNQEPLPLEALLRREQCRLREQASAAQAPVQAPAGTRP
jgi:hypothetical protein